MNQATSASTTYYPSIYDVTIQSNGNFNSQQQFDIFSMDSSGLQCRAVKSDSSLNRIYVYIEDTALLGTFYLITGSTSGIKQYWTTEISH